MGSIMQILLRNWWYTVNHKSTIRIEKKKKKTCWYSANHENYRVIIFFFFSSFACSLIQLSTNCSVSYFYSHYSSEIKKKNLKKLIPVITALDLIRLAMNCDYDQWCTNERFKKILVCSNSHTVELLQYGFLELVKWNDENVQRKV